AMMLFPPGLRHMPWTEAGGAFGAVAWAAAASIRPMIMPFLSRNGRSVKIAAFGDHLDVARMTAGRRSHRLRRIAGGKGRGDDVLAQMAQHIRMVLEPASDDVDHVAVGVALDDAVNRDQPRAHDDLAL